MLLLLLLLQELILSGLRLTSLAEDTFTGLRRLRLLDLRDNQLSTLDRATLLGPLGPPSLQHVLLAGTVTTKTTILQLLRG